LGKAKKKATPSRTKSKTAPKAIVEQPAAPPPREPVVHIVEESGVVLSASANLAPPHPSQTLDGKATFEINSKSPGKVGRRPSLTPEQIEEGIRILQSHGKMSLEAACATLKVQGIETSKSSINRLVWTPTYRSGSK
jgi:hypothetical protein